MSFADWIGFIGVFQILIAYALNVAGKITNESLTFILLNVIGAAMACFASILINYWPFIILEAIWTLVSLYSLIKLYKKRSI